MSNTIKHRYEFMFLFDCENGNPNGDPDAGNAPRIDPQDMHGLVSDVAIKRRIRNYVQLVEGNKTPNSIYIQNATNLNTKIAEAHEEANGQMPTGAATTEQVGKAKDWMCKNFFDVRTFGAVMSTGANAGQVRGPVQIAFAKSEHPIMQLDISMTRMAVTDNLKDAKSSEDYKKWEAEQPEDKMRTFGRKTIIPYGLFVGKAFVSAHLAEQTGFSSEDLKLFVNSLLNMYEHDRSASKGMMTTRKVYAMKHVGTDDGSDEQRAKQAKLGCCPAQLLFEEVVKIKLNDDKSFPRAFADYVVSVDDSVVPTGVELLEFPRDIDKLN